MTHRLTPDTLLSLPRPSAAIPNPSGTFYILPYTQFSFDTGRTTRSVALGEIPRIRKEDSEASGKHDVPDVVDLLSNLRYSEVAWLDDETVIYLRPRGSETDTPDVAVELSDEDFKKQLDKDDNQQPGRDIWCKTISGSSYRVGTVPVEIADLKVAQTSPSDAILAFSVEVYPDEPSLDAVDRLDKKATDAKKGADVQVFDKLFVRHWDAWTTEKKKLVFCVNIAKRSELSVHDDESDDVDLCSVSSEDNSNAEVNNGTKSAKDAVWRMTSKPASPLAGFHNIECPGKPFGGTNDFDVIANHLAFVAKDPHLPEAWHTRMHVYVVPLFAKNEEEKKPKCLTSGGGARSYPIFSPSAKAQANSREKKGKLAWLEMRKDGYEADRNRIMVYDVETDQKYELLERTTAFSPTSLTWGEGDSTLLGAADLEGHKVLFAFDVPTDLTSLEKSDATWKQLTHSGTVSSFRVLPTIVTKKAQGKPSAPPAATNLLVTVNSFTSPNEAFHLAYHVGRSEKAQLTRISKLSSGLVVNLSMDSSEEFWFTGADPSRTVHGFLLRPHGYEKGKKYGLAFLVHGGPQSAWNSSWSTRWNLNAWTAQGYVVVAINPTGSTGYGQDFVDAINCNMGGSPFKDLVSGLEFVKRTYSELIDTERMVMLGASYGGYMANWIQGHNDVTKFKAIVCHDGILDTKHVWYSGDELYFPEHDLGGTPWDAQAEYEKWNPINHIHNWNTPELIIHGGLDYRLPETEGIGAFNILQRRGVPSKLVYFPKENHWVINPYNSRRWHEEIFAWMEEWVGTGPSA